LFGVPADAKEKQEKQRNKSGVTSHSLEVKGWVTWNGAALGFFGTEK
jgi:hypothetical protein